MNKLVFIGSFLLSLSCLADAGQGEHTAGYHWFSSRDTLQAVGNLTRKIPPSE